MHEPLIRKTAWNLPARPVWGVADCALAIAVLSLLFLSVAIWNRFPLTFYDSGGYLREGLEHVFLAQRAPVYADFLFVVGAAFSLWFVVVVQSLMTSYILMEVARAEVPKLTLIGLTAIGAALCFFTGIAWYVGQVEPDVFTPLVILGSHLLLFRSNGLGKARLALVTGLTGLAVACHPSHLGLLCGLLIGAILLRLVVGWKPYLPNPDLRRGVTGLALALILILAGNFALTGQFFISKSGSTFLIARLMQDRIVQRLLDDTCPPKGDMNWRLCSYKNRIPISAEAWLWDEGSSFQALGAFKNPAQQDENWGIVVESIKRYPLMHLRKAVSESLRQFRWIKTGDGIDPQQSSLEPQFKRMIPAQLPAYLGARQQQSEFNFKPLNQIHVPVGIISLLALVFLLHHAVVRRRWLEGSLPALVLLGLIGNAIICGTFSNPHDRYQSRVIWLPTLVLLLALARDRRGLQPIPDPALNRMGACAMP